MSDNSPLAPMMAALHVEDSPDDHGLHDLRKLLTDAVDQRGSYYTHFATFALRFEADDTDAAQDTASFQLMLNRLGMPVAKEIIIKANDRFAESRTSAQLTDLMEPFVENEGRKLVIGHYAGHGGLDEDHQLSLFASGSSVRGLPFDSVFGPCFRSHDTYYDTDFVIIVDSCYSGAATRAWDSIPRSAEIVAAVGIDQQPVGNRSDAVRRQVPTFTSRITNEILRRVQGSRATSVSIAEIIAKFRTEANQARLPEYRLRCGRVGVRIPVLPQQAPLPSVPGPASSDWRRRHETSSSSSASGERLGTPSASLPLPAIEAVFRVHLRSDDPEGEEAKRLVDWVRSLHPLVGLRMTGLYRSRSTVLIFEAPWLLWSRLDGLRGFSLVCENFGGNLLPRLQAAAPQPPSRAARPLSMPPFMPLANITNRPRSRSPARPTSSHDDKVNRREQR